MYIDSIIIEGFKSYAQRTVISGFHEHFNAITGLNGSGKSNVLDAICFVLGISNLSQVRAQNLQDLVYKKGQAGITKASVQLVFNNEDRDSSPHGYEAMDQIIVMREIQVGGGSKYRINGKNAEAGKVQQLFRSVQLNVNNPTFLIMQGRVTKVLNMKPPEILAMVEEAAGTKMYESNKNNAVKLIEKKEKKLAEIDEVLTNEIGPRMRQLNEERSTYLTFQKNQQELDKIERMSVAYDFHVSKERLSTVSLELQESADKIKESKIQIESLNISIKDKEANLDALRRKREQETGGGLRDLEKEVQNMSKELVTVTTIHKNGAESLTAEAENKQRMESEIEEAIAFHHTRQADLAKEKEKQASLQEESNRCEAEVEQTQAALLAAQAGMGGGKNLAKSFAEQLREAENDASVASTEYRQAEMRLKHATAEYKKKKPAAASAEKAHESINKERQIKVQDLAKIQQQLDSCGYNAEEAERVTSERIKLQKEVREMQDIVDKLESSMSSLQFEYSDPVPNFDRKRVHGLVARLIRVSNATYSTALEVAAGGKLFNVIVDSQDTGGKLLKNGKLKQRVTIIPLDKIAARQLSSDVVSKAGKEVGKDNVHLALSLVGYPEEVEKAMHYVFGTTLVCKDPKSAQAVTFNPAIKTRSVTIDGDVYEPSGTLTGGSRTSKSSILTQLQELNAAEEQLASKQRALTSLLEQEAEHRQRQSTHTKILQQWELRNHDITLLDERIRSSTHGQQLLELQELEKSIQEQENAKQEAMQKEKAAKERIAAINRESKDFAANADTELKRMEKQIAELKKQAHSKSQAAKKKQQDVEAILLELEEILKDVERMKGKVLEIDANIAKLTEQVAEQERTAETVKVAYEEKKDQLDKKRAKLEETDASIAAMERQRRDAVKEHDELELAQKKLANQKTRLEKELTAAKDVVSHLYSTHKWIKSAEETFGMAGSAFDFQKENMRDLKDRLEKLKEQQKRLTNQVNMKALSMMEDIKKEHEELLKKKDIVEKDKDKILQSIQELDKKKAEALEKTHAKVNKDFGSIFSTLLPGTQARLEPPPGMSVHEGLEVKVAFGNTWKESLTELSGGQRSLIALSLILSLLLFKPAPMYILDEIDAALDLSHTQNIGKMLRTHFSQSQFIVVSLKEGMFNNANVLFRVRFVDGTSTITRYAQDVDENADNTTGKRVNQKSKPLASRNRA